MKKFKLMELSPLQKFKQQNAVVKKFGKVGFKVYNALSNTTYKSSEDVAKELGMELAKVNEILSFMEQEGFVDVEVEEQIKPSVEEKPVEEEPKPVKESVISPDVEIKPEEHKVDVVDQEVEQPSSEPVIEPESSEIKPEIEEQQDVVEEEKVGGVEVEQIQREENNLKIESEFKEQEETTSVEQSLTPSEMIIYDKYGMEGVNVFRLVDGVRTIDEIAKEAGISKDRVMEILKFSEDVGLISLGLEKEEKKEQFVPLTAEFKEEEIPGEPIPLIKLKKIDIITQMRLKLNVVLKFGKAGRVMLEFLEKKGMTNLVEISKKLKVPVSMASEFIKMLEKEGVIKKVNMDRSAISKVFGYDAYIIYKKYGVKGLVFYELIGEDVDIKRIAHIIGEKDPDKVVEIFEMIHKVLGIPIPIDRMLLKKQLT